MRFSLPNSRIMVHQPSGGYQGQATDIMIHAQETQKLKDRLNQIYVKHTGQDLRRSQDALERDNFMSPEEAKEWGLIDEIVENRKAGTRPRDRRSATRQPPTAGRQFLRLRGNRGWPRRFRADQGLTRATETGRDGPRRIRHGEQFAATARTRSTAPSAERASTRCAS